MSVVVEVKLSQDEKSAIIKHLNSSKANYEAKKKYLEGEKAVLERMRSKPPKDTTDSWLKELDKRIEAWGNKIKTLVAALSEYSNICNSIESNKVVSFKDKAFLLKELYTIEAVRKKVEHKYNYYPRSKKAKEASMYVFANKIKIIMESENVQIT